MADERILSKAELAAIRARAEQATPGPWHHGADGGIVAEGSAAAIARRDAGGTAADADFIAAARTDIPRLLAGLATYHEIVAQLAYYPNYGEDVWLPVLRARAQALFAAPAQE
ncbi:MAG TPA: hypothetical protein VGR57_11020 [Ktedonobacterales bacterium]|nr:hypothetical protein [Ktedonobacterales bacterium]